MHINLHKNKYQENLHPNRTMVVTEDFCCRSTVLIFRKEHTHVLHIQELTFKV